MNRLWNIRKSKYLNLLAFHVIDQSTQWAEDLLEIICYGYCSISGRPSKLGNVNAQPDKCVWVFLYFPEYLKQGIHYKSYNLNTNEKDALYQNICSLLMQQYVMNGTIGSVWTVESYSESA